MSNKVSNKISNKAPGKIRIVGGQYKRTPLSVPAIEGLRPTPDRVRETLFNWLGNLVQQKRCLDLFAGTGALGIEAVSRGAASAVLVEANKLACQGIEDTLRRLKDPSNIMLHTKSAEAFLLSARATPSFDVVFLDPPFGQQWLEKILPRLMPLLSSGALVYVESESSADSLLPLLSIGATPTWEIVRGDKAGQVYYHLLKFLG
jgi:16S rRNA (guanine966-N2)-methyltransferase